MQMRFFLLLLPALSIDCLSFPQLDEENARVCPYPWPEDIAPCVCQTNEKFQVFLTCDMWEDVTDRNGKDPISKLYQAFQCNNEIFSFDINLNGHAWKIDISKENVGKFKMSYFSLSNYASIDGYVKPGTFSLSQESLMGVRIQKINDKKDHYYHDSGIKTGAFSDLDALTSITIEGFKTINQEAFSNLPNLKELTLSGLAGSIPKRAFYNMKNLKEITFEKSTIGWSIETNAFEDLPSLEHLDLSNLGIRSIEPDAFSNLPRLNYLDLSNNQYLKYIGNSLATASANMYVNLTKTKVTTISENSFKVFFENILENNGEGRIEMERLRCSCDMKWLLVSKLDVSSILGNMKCSDGKYINEVSKQF